PFVDYITFSSTSCEVREGCGTPGRRRVLRFETETRNIGTADLVFGNPVLNPLFVYDPCHNHYHFGQFAEYRLLDQSGTLVVEGKKIGFCLEDVLRWDPSAARPPNRSQSSFPDRKSTRLNSSHVEISYAVFCLKK